MESKLLITLEIHEHLFKDVISKRMDVLLTEQEMLTSQLLAEMQFVGVGFDSRVLQEQVQHLNEEIMRV
jgi:DNA polymerase I-like protein with 3'-5' exonuclease and polymerase domains